MFSLNRTLDLTLPADYYAVSCGIWIKVFCFPNSFLFLYLGRQQIRAVGTMYHLACSFAYFAGINGEAYTKWEEFVVYVVLEKHLEVCGVVLDDQERALNRFQCFGPHTVPLPPQCTLIFSPFLSQNSVSSVTHSVLHQKP